MEAIPNQIEKWLPALPRPTDRSNKYDRGYVAIYAAPHLTGATRLAATACNRIGAGLVGVVASSRADVYRTCLPPDIMVNEQLPSKASVALGGSGGIEPQHFEELLRASHMEARVFDADALPGREHFHNLDSTCILTPHHGEFERAFGPIEANPELAAHGAARASGAIVVLKSSRTIIASPDGSLIANTHASPYLAKAGTGDVLAGLIAGLAGQGMVPLSACCAAVWIHGEAGLGIGPGLVASDIPGRVPSILKTLLSSQG